MSVDVSVIIPVHNRMSYLQASVDSILEQKWRGTLEVIIVADGMDLEPESALKLPDDLSVRILKKPHEGVGAARQQLVQHVFDVEPDIQVVAQRTAGQRQEPGVPFTTDQTIQV